MILENRRLLNEQEKINFTNEIMSDLENLGFTKTGVIGKDWEGFIRTNEHQGRYFTLEKGKIMLLFNENDGLLLMTVGTRISIADMGSDNLSNSAFAKSFKAYDNDRNVLTGGVGMGPEQTAPFIYWLTNSFTTQNTTGTSKESTPFYTQYYPDIVKLSQIDDKFSKFNDASIKDQAKMVGQIAKDAGQQIGQGVKNFVGKFKNN
jgi:hypothetical protein